MQDGKALQAGTSHHLAQNFAKAFDVKFQNEKGDQEYVYASSWGVSTRLIGALIMAHGDDKGIIIPPKLATTQLAIIPIHRTDEQRASVTERLDQITGSFEGIGFTIDDRQQHSPGYKFNWWEQRGVPVRMEMGPKDLEKNQVVLVRRDTGEKSFVSQDNLAATISGMLDQVQRSMFENALAFRAARTYLVDDYGQFNLILDGPEAGFLWSHWCGSADCEDKVKVDTKATIRCIPLDGEQESGVCIVCGQASVSRVVFSRAY